MPCVAKYVVICRYANFAPSIVIFSASYTGAEYGQAISRAEEVLNGADCFLTFFKPNAGPVATDWKTQKSVSNGSPTYGRKHEGLGVSVKKATSGQWYYVTYSG